MRWMNGSLRRKGNESLISAPWLVLFIHRMCAQMSIESITITRPRASFSLAPSRRTVAPCPRESRRHRRGAFRSGGFLSVVCGVCDAQRVLFVDFSAVDDEHGELFLLVDGVVVDAVLVEELLEVVHGVLHEGFVVVAKLDCVHFGKDTVGGD